MDKVNYLYRHSRTDNNEPFYIGIGSRIDSDFTYKRAFNRDRRSQDWINYTKELDFYVEILFETENLSLILEKEIEFIRLYGRKIDGGILCNISTGGKKPSFKPLTPEEKLNLSEKLKGVKKPVGFSQKLSDRSMGNKYNLGKSLSKETKSKISKSNKKYYDNLSKEQKEIIKIKLLEFAKRPKLNYIKTEQYEINKQTQRKEVLQFDMNHNLIEVYDSISQAALENNLAVGKISLCCNKKRKSHGKFIWEFKK